jgi:hypothetical protein
MFFDILHFAVALHFKKLNIFYLNDQSKRKASGSSSVS